jgi:hypothetical protein
MIHEKKLKRKNLWLCPFKRGVDFKFFSLKSFCEIQLEMKHLPGSL